MSRTKGEGAEATIDVNIPTILIDASRHNPVSRRIVASSIASELVAKAQWAAKYPKWVGLVLWWWQSTPLWERACTIIFTPILAPLGLALVLAPLWLAVAIIWVIVAIIVRLVGG